MLRKFGSTLALILGLMLTLQSAAAVDHVHLELTDIASCVVCTAYSTDDEIITAPAGAPIPGTSPALERLAPFAGTTLLPESNARAPPVCR